MLKYIASLLIVLLGLTLLAVGIFWPAEETADAQSPTVSDYCTSSNIQNLTRPFPSNSAGELLLVNCYSVNGSGAVARTLSQVLTSTAPSVSSNDRSTITANAGAMQVWRQGSWFLVSSTYDASSQTYVFQALPGTNIYAFFYPINRSSQDQVSAGTTTGNVIEDAQAAVESNAPLRAALFSSGMVLSLAGLMFTLQRRKSGGMTPPM